MTRHRDKTVATGWDTVRKGDAAAGGAVAAVVCASERRVVWARLFDPAEYDAVTINVREYPAVAAVGRRRPPGLGRPVIPQPAPGPASTGTCSHRWTPPMKGGKSASS
ncbi:hypothetical protein [Streptomyces atroolivaceus]|uniref:hypothetical protein n=1 Tax=Streptomyces atroolivaceus TaxID=66869 RepID=UPI0036C21DF8